MEKAKPFQISKKQVWYAFKKVRANRGSAGVDGQSIAEFEKDLSNNLYKLWNRLASGSYFPVPVRRVEIPKGDGRKRPLGIPTVTDRIAQMVVKQALEPLLNLTFMKTHTGIVPGSPLMMLLGLLVADVGDMAGCWILTSRGSLTASTMS